MVQPAGYASGWVEIIEENEEDIYVLFFFLYHFNSSSLS
jgi:hypothetical protein